MDEIDEETRLLSSPTFRPRFGFGVFNYWSSGSAVLASTYPVFSQTHYCGSLNSPSSSQSIFVGENVFHTDISQNLETKRLPTPVQKGDTVSTNRPEVWNFRRHNPLGK